MTTDDKKQIAEWQKQLAELKVKPFDENSVRILYRITRSLKSRKDIRDRLEQEIFSIREPLQRAVGDFLVSAQILYESLLVDHPFDCDENVARLISRAQFHCKIGLWIN